MTPDRRRQCLGNPPPPPLPPSAGSNGEKDIYIRTQYFKAEDELGMVLSCYNKQENSLIINALE